MNFERFIALRISKKEKDANKANTRPMVRLTIIGIAISLSVMLLSVSIMRGFKKEVRKHAYNLSGQITIYPYGTEPGNTTQFIKAGKDLLNAINNVDGVSRVSPAVRQVGVIKTDSAYNSTLLLGIDSTFDTRFYEKNLRSGNIDELFTPLEGTNPLLLPKVTAEKLKLKTGEKIRIYFIGENIKVRSFTIVGIYESGTKADQSTALCPITTLQKINNWQPDNFSQLMIWGETEADNREISDRIVTSLQSNQQLLGSQRLGINTAEEIYPVIFGWLNMLDGNVALLMALMVLVAGFTMITGLIILLLDNTILIGTLKALGSTNKSIRKVFQNLSAILIIKGLFWGNATALVICFLQSYFNIVKLNPEAYLMDVVPISINIFQWIAINLGALFLILLMTWGPTRIISRINPSETMRFE